MKISLNWLKSFIDIKLPNDELKKVISLNVVEVEQMYQLVTASNLEIGLVKECLMHSDSNHLHVCSVELSDGVFQIVCGAPNVKQGQKVIVARIGAVLAGNLVIKKSTIRGVESNGMICSLKELGIEDKYITKDSQNGIYVLGSDAKIGKDPLKYLGFDDTVIELGLTPNRGDLLSVLGVAYDLGAVCGIAINYPPIELVEKGQNDVTIRVDSKDVLAYHARKITNIVIKESPNWLKARLISSGIRPINNVVDITNYVMIELGQPLHAFDADIIGNKIVVRDAFENEATTSLDEVNRILSIEDIVITNGKTIIAIGGVMGCMESMVKEKTTSIILESACFNPLTIRKTAQKLGIHSESSMRFERKVDPNRVVLAIDLAAKMLTQLANGEIQKGIASYDIQNKKEKNIRITSERINRYLGTNISNQEILSIIHKLQFKAVMEKDLFTIMVPTRRVDIEHYQDIIEEIARVYGYNNILTTLPLNDSLGKLSEKQKWIRNIRHILADMGLSETINYSLLNKKDLDVFVKPLGDVSLIMPITEDHQTLRQSLLNGIVETMKYNKSRQAKDIFVFEIGKIYHTRGEALHLGIGMMGNINSSLWQGKKGIVDFYVLKGIMEYLFSKINVEANYEKVINNGLHPGITASILVKETVIGFIGAIHPDQQKYYDLDKTFVLEIDLDKLFSLSTNKIYYQTIPKHPFITRDLAIVVDRNIMAEDIIKLIKQTNKKILKEVMIFDLYIGDKIEEGLKSLALSLIFQDEDKTLVSIDVDKVIESILLRLKQTFKANIRT